MALTGKTISQLTKYTSTLTGNELFPLEYNGATYHVSQSQFSSNIYNINGTLTGDRVLSTGAYKLAIKWNAPFSAYNNIPTTNIFQVKSSTDENAISVWSNGSAAIGRNAIPVSGYGLTVDNGNNSGIYAGGIDVLGAVSAIGGSVIIGQYGAKAIFFNDNASTGYVLYNITDGLVVSSGQYAGAKYNTTVQNYDGKGLRVFGPTGNVAIGGSTFTDEGYKLDVSGSAIINDVLYLRKSDQINIINGKADSTSSSILISGRGQDWWYNNINKVNGLNGGAARNILIGNTIWSNITSASQNIVLSTGNAGGGLTNGNYNIFIGNNAGAGITNGSNNIHIGTHDGSFTAGLSDFLGLGNFDSAADEATGDVIIGGTVTGGYTNMYLGTGKRQRYFSNHNFTIQPTGARSTHANIGNLKLTLASGRGSGEGEGSVVIISASVPTVSGSTQQSLKEQFMVSNTLARATDMLGVQTLAEVNTITGTAFTTGGTLADGNHYYTIYAFDRFGNSGAVSYENSIPISGGGGSGSVQLSWNAIEDAAFYRIYFGDARGNYSNYVEVATNSYLDIGAAGTALTRTITNKATKYFFAQDGISIPRRTNAQMLATTYPMKGQTIFNSTDSFIYYYNGSSWINLSTDNLSQIATGSVTASVNAGSNIFNIISGSNTLVVVDNVGSVGIGTTSPSYKLDVNGLFRSVSGLRYIATGGGNEFFTIHDGTNALLRANSANGNIILGRGENFYVSSTQIVSTFSYDGGAFATVSKPIFQSFYINNGNGGAGSRTLIGIDITGNSAGNYTDFYVHRITNSIPIYSTATTYAYSNNDFHNAFNTNSGSTIIGSLSLNNSAKLQIDSTTQGFLPPRMTNTQRTNISSPAVGLMVYCTDATEGLYVYKSTGWTFIV